MILTGPEVKCEERMQRSLQLKLDNSVRRNMMVILCEWPLFGLTHVVTQYHCMLAKLWTQRNQKILRGETRAGRCEWWYSAAELHNCSIYKLRFDTVTWNLTAPCCCHLAAYEWLMSRCWSVETIIALPFLSISRSIHWFLQGCGGLHCIKLFRKQRHFKSINVFIFELTLVLWPSNTPCRLWKVVKMFLLHGVWS